MPSGGRPRSHKAGGKRRSRKSKATTGGKRRSKSRSRSRSSRRK